MIYPTTIDDQAFWGRRVHALGARPVPIPQGKLNAEALSRALHAANTDDRMRERVASLAAQIRAENGVARAVELIGSVVSYAPYVSGRPALLPRRAG